MHNSDATKVVSAGQKVACGKDSAKRGRVCILMRIVDLILQDIAAQCEKFGADYPTGSGPGLRSCMRFYYPSAAAP